MEERVLAAGDRRRALERAHFDALCDRVAMAGSRLAAFGASIAALDALASLAEVGVRRNWVRPELDEGDTIELVGSRHPVVEAFLEDGRFVPNDLVLDAGERRLGLLTGPNMGGKSTLLRQVALAVVLAQMGAPVPADRARVGLCDRVFTRVGASDDLVRGQSTFMVEMSETSAILAGATARSLVVLDEIGRGTSTWDGLAIAWAVAEDLAERIRCKALFATHYHELCGLADTHRGVFNSHVAVAERQGDIVFLHRVRPGGANRSYGIQCARLAGLPGPVVARASALLARFERTAPRDDHAQMSLFGHAPREAAEPPPPPAALEELARLDPDAMSPREALDALYALRALLP
jgi:DNA mismatch repair protein MutS